MEMRFCYLIMTACFRCLWLHALSLSVSCVKWCLQLKMHSKPTSFLNGYVISFERTETAAKYNRSNLYCFYSFQTKYKTLVEKGYKEMFVSMFAPPSAPQKEKKTLINNYQ